MRVIEAQHRQAVPPCAPNRVDVILRINEEACRILGDVASGDGLGDGDSGADEHAAAFARRFPAGVRGDRIEHAAGDAQLGQSASTAIAIPIPPPMQSDATP